jgi:hypothetical protein
LAKRSGPDRKSGSLLIDFQIYSPLNYASRREIIWGFINEYGLLCIGALAIFSFFNSERQVAVVAAVLATLLFQNVIYMLIGNMQGEHYPAMAILVGLYLPVGLALKNRWDIRLFARNGLNDPS